MPLEGNDAFLFASLALLAAACLGGKLGPVWVLITGGILGTLNFYVNLGEVSNGIALWLGISPPDLFFYALIPPLAVDSALRLDMFLFRKARRCGRACGALSCSMNECSTCWHGCWPCSVPHSSICRCRHGCRPGCTCCCWRL